MRLKYPILIFLSIVFTLALTFVTLELPLLLESVLIEYFPVMLFYDFAPRDALLFYARPIGYACLALVITLIIMGFITDKKRLSKFGSLTFLLPTFGYFVLHMFFLSGIGILRVLWLPIWDLSPTLLKLGDISYIPYWIVMQPLKILSENGIGFWLTYAKGIATLSIAVGLLIFCIGIFTWLDGKLEKKKVFDYWIYKYSRHPQYLGFIVWSYGILLLSSLNSPVFGPVQPRPSLPWMISVLLIICVAMAEEISMIKQANENYLQYRKISSFMLPLPQFLVKIIKIPNKLILKKDFPENKKDVLYTFSIYSMILILFSFIIQNLNLFEDILLL